MDGAQLWAFSPYSFPRGHSAGRWALSLPELTLSPFFWEEETAGGWSGLKGTDGRVQAQCLPWEASPPSLLRPGFMALLAGL